MLPLSVSGATVRYLVAAIDVAQEYDNRNDAFSWC